MNHCHDELKEKTQRILRFSIRHHEDPHTLQVEAEFDALWADWVRTVKVFHTLGLSVESIPSLIDDELSQKNTEKVQAWVEKMIANYNNKGLAQKIWSPMN